MIESAERHAVAGCLVCVASLVVLVTAAYEIGPVVRLDDSVLSALSTPPGSLLNEAAFGVEQLVAPLAWVVAAALACLLATALRRPGHGFFAAALIGGTAVIDLTLKVVLEHLATSRLPASSGTRYRLRFQAATRRAPWR